MVRIRHAAVIVLSAVIATVSLVAQAHASVGAVVITGNVKPKARKEIVMSAVETAARDAGWSLADRQAFTARDTDEIVTCGTADEPSACMPKAVDLANVTAVLLVSVDDDKEQDGSPVVMLTGRAVIAAQEIVVRGQRYCEHCSSDVLTQLSGELARDLLKQLALRVGHTIVTIRSNPSGARIMLDGDAIGATDGTFTTFPGKHSLSVDKVGFEIETRTIDVPEDKTTDVMVTLRSTKPDVPHGHEHPVLHHARHGRGAAPWLLGGVGLAAVASGIALVLADDGGVSGGQLVPEHRSLKPWGYASIGLGILALGTSTYLFVKPLPASEQDGGVAFGIGGQF